MCAQPSWSGRWDVVNPWANMLPWELDPGTPTREESCLHRPAQWNSCHFYKTPTTWFQQSVEGAWKILKALKWTKSQRKKQINKWTNWPGPETQSFWLKKSTPLSPRDSVNIKLAFMVQSWTEQVILVAVEMASQTLYNCCMRFNGDGWLRTDRRSDILNPPCQTEAKNHTETENTALKHTDKLQQMLQIHTGSCDQYIILLYPNKTYK